MRMGQGVRTGLGHGGVTCVLQTQFSSLSRGGGGGGVGVAGEERRRVKSQRREEEGQHKRKNFATLGANSFF